MGVQGCDELALQLPEQPISMVFAQFFAAVFTRKGISCRERPQPGACLASPASTCQTAVSPQYLKFVILLSIIHAHMQFWFCESNMYVCIQIHAGERVFEVSVVVLSS